MGRVSFAMQVVSYFLLFVIIVWMVVASPVPAIIKFIKDPFRPDVSISTWQSVYDENQGRLKLVIIKGDDVEGNYLSFTFYPNNEDREYAFMRAKLLEEKTELYFDISNCVESFDAISVSLRDTKEKNYFSKRVKIKNGALADNHVYHNLCSFCQIGGVGEKADPYVVCDCYGLQNMSGNLNAHYALGGTIDCNDFSNTSVFESVGDNYDPFVGSLDGRGNIIYGLDLGKKGENYVGIFGVLYNGEVKDVGLSGFDVVGELFVGSLVGRQEEGLVTRSYVKNSNVSGSANVGGLIGFSNGNIEDCYSTADVESRIFAGGLVGGFEGEMRRSYFAGSVKALYSGLVGKKSPLAEISSSYFDLNKLPNPTTRGGVGYLTPQFEFSEIYYDWDLEDVWRFEEGDSYPELRYAG